MRMYTKVSYFLKTSPLALHTRVHQHWRVFHLKIQNYWNFTHMRMYTDVSFLSKNKPFGTPHMRMNTDVFFL
jgi:hypothetical protein